MPYCETISYNQIVQQQYPNFIKYMGSKSKIMDFILNGINDVHTSGIICDLFSGSGSLAGAIGQQCTVHSNDIQAYSSIISKTYSLFYKTEEVPTAKKILQLANLIVETHKLNNFIFDYNQSFTIKEFNAIEERQKSLINQKFKYEWHIFAKCYSGTWWSYEQCLWIDAIREVANHFKTTPYFSAIISSLMYAMAYTSQGTGHYAQYRDAKTISSLNDILIYRKKNIQNFFEKKYNEVLMWAPNKKTQHKHIATNLDFKDCLMNFKGGTIYADPPYCFVHYSRFYHTLETLVLYDFPNLQIKNGQLVKGRYRENRHQSPFSIRTQVKDAFKNLFEGVQHTKSNLVMSYSNTGMISINEIENIALKVFPKNRSIEILSIDHQHMTLGRKNDHLRDVKECLFLIK